MQSFTFYIDDDRFAFPIRMPVQLPEGAAVRERAEALLDRSKHYRGIEVYAAATPLFRIGATVFAVGKRI